MIKSNKNELVEFLLYTFEFCLTHFIVLDTNLITVFYTTTSSSPLLLLLHFFLLNFIVPSEIQRLGDSKHVTQPNNNFSISGHAYSTDQILKYVDH